MKEDGDKWIKNIQNDLKPLVFIPSENFSPDDGFLSKLVQKK